MNDIRIKYVENPDGYVLDRVKEIADTAFQFSSFRNDKNLINAIREKYKLIGEPTWGFISKTYIELDNNKKLFLAISNNRIVGFLSFYKPIKFQKYHMVFSNLLLLAVEEDYRRRGIATLLIKEYLKFLYEEARGLKDISKILVIVETDGENIPARSLYEKLGFKKIGEIDVFRKAVKNIKVVGKLEDLLNVYNEKLQDYIIPTAHIIGLSKIMNNQDFSRHTLQNFVKNNIKRELVQVGEVFFIASPDRLTSLALGKVFGIKEIPIFVLHPLTLEEIPNKISTAEYISCDFLSFSVFKGYLPVWLEKAIIQEFYKASTNILYGIERCLRTEN